MTHLISDSTLTLKHFTALLKQNVSVELSPQAKTKIIQCRKFLDEKLSQTNQPVYGINTGFGSLYNRNIPKDQLEILQENLVKSHACGTGPKVPPEIVKLMLFLKVQSLAYGYSGVQIETVQRLLDLYNENILPVVYEMGSLGASGDLAPLAHLSLPIIGMGEVLYEGKFIAASDLYQKKNWTPIRLKAKEGLALLNGTQFMAAYGTWCMENARRIQQWSTLIATLSLDVFEGRPEPFFPEVHAIRPHPGQIEIAASVMRYLEGSELIHQPKRHVQDPYSFRCIPQVHGASVDTFSFVEKTILTEVNSVTDNPNIFPESDKIISAGNFHGQPLALALDFLSIALAELGSISERRTFQLISGARDLPNYLVANPGINSGLMIPQYTAASLVSQNKQLCSPASVDSIVSSNGQEDHVSMGANAATKAYRVVQNVYSILAIEWITAAQALTFRRPRKTSPLLEKLVHTLRARVPFIEDDRVLHTDIMNAEKLLKETDPEGC